MSWYTTVHVLGCYSYQWECDSGQCIDEDYRCNGYDNCYDGSDEDGCGMWIVYMATIGTSLSTCVYTWKIVCFCSVHVLSMFCHVHCTGLTLYCACVLYHFAHVHF